MAKKSLQSPPEAKWVLASTTVRIALVSLLPSVKILLTALGVSADDKVLEASIDIISAAVGVGAAGLIIYRRHKQSPLTMY